GWLDAADCNTIRGWAQDPDSPNAVLRVDLYLDSLPGQPGAKVISAYADQSRADLCSALGSCNHAYSTVTPLLLINGQPHFVTAFAIDTGGGVNPELSGGSKVVNCPLSLPSGVKRHIGDPASFTSWAFSPIWDFVQITDAEGAAFPTGQGWPEDRVLLREQN